MQKTCLVLIVCVLLGLSGCAKRQGAANANGSDASEAKNNAVEKVKPAPGTGNVQGKVLYNGAPVENIEVKMCETFSRFLSGCGG
jgi:hypothetical protein